MATPRPAQPADPAARPGGILCPYCGHISANPRRCEVCAGYFDPLSRQASQNAMGPWFLRDASAPFRPGCSFETLKELIKRGKVTRNTVLRGPTTRQFWSFAGRTPSVANLLGVCHNCASEVPPDAFSCAACGAAFTPDADRQHLGLAPVHLLPGQAAPEIIAAAAASEAGKPLPAKSAGRPPAIAKDQAPPARERRRISAGWIAAGMVVLLVVAGCVWVILWALNAPVPQRPGALAQSGQPAPAPSPAPVPESPPLEERPESPPAPVVATPEPEPEPAPVSPPAPPPEEPKQPELLEEFNAGNVDLAQFREKVRALFEAGRISEAERRGWDELIKRREEQERLKRLP